MHVCVDSSRSSIAYSGSMGHEAGANFGALGPPCSVRPAAVGTEQAQQNSV